MPTILLNIIGHSSNYLKQLYFETTVSMNLTVNHKHERKYWKMRFSYFQVMLVLTTMFASVNESLPRTSYIKMVDIWLIFTFCIPFIEVLLQIYKVSYQICRDEILITTSSFMIEIGYIERF